jgi:YbgC/YbaW family acyl-CoA thioester hydrolase
MTPPGRSAPVAETVVTVRSPEIDSFGHVNHAVFLNYLEHARYLALEEAGLDWSSLADEGWQIFVVRIELDYLAEATRGDGLLIRTWAASFRRTTMVLAQEIVRDDDPEILVARAQVTAVWIGYDGRPTRVPAHIREGLESGAKRG